MFLSLGRQQQQDGFQRHSKLPRRSTAESDRTLVGVDSDAPTKQLKSTQPKRFSFSKLTKRPKKIDRHDVSLSSVLKISLSVGEGANIPYLKGLSGIVLVIWEAVQATEENMTRCLHLQKMIHELLDIVQSHLQNEKQQLSPAFDFHLDGLRCTLEQLTRRADVYRKRKYLTRFLGSSTDKTFFNECEKTIENALANLRFRATVATAAAGRRHEREENEFHDQALQLLNGLPSALPVQVSTVQQTITRSKLGAFEFPDRTDELPQAPQIFHGRDSQVSSLTHSLTQGEPARVIILGPGGVGKSSLALTVLHTLPVSSKFGSKRYAFDCDTVAFPSELYLKMATVFACSSTRNGILHALERLQEPVLLLFDNLERIWEPSEYTLVVEDFMTELAAIRNLSLFATVRGRQLPLGPLWKPLHLSPLDPISAKNVFMDISDASDSPEIDTLLRDIADYLPLPITLIAHLAQYEEVPLLLERLEEEGTSILSVGSGRTSDMDTSIAISLSSPRVTACPHALGVLRAFAVTENPLSRPTLSSRQNLPASIQRCISVLSAVSLLSETQGGYLKVPAPVRIFLEKHNSL